jgi:hypothetical protein
MPAAAFCIRLRVTANFGVLADRPAELVTWSKPSGVGYAQNRKSVLRNIRLISIIRGSLKRLQERFGNGISQFFAFSR